MLSGPATYSSSRHRPHETGGLTESVSAAVAVGEWTGVRGPSSRWDAALLAAGWILFAVAFGLGLLLGWLVWA